MRFVGSRRLQLFKMGNLKSMLLQAGYSGKQAQSLGVFQEPVIAKFMHWGLVLGRTWIIYHTPEPPKCGSDHLTGTRLVQIPFPEYLMLHELRKLLMRIGSSSFTCLIVDTTSGEVYEGNLGDFTGTAYLSVRRSIEDGGVQVRSDIGQ